MLTYAHLAPPLLLLCSGKGQRRGHGAGGEERLTEGRERHEGVRMRTSSNTAVRHTGGISSYYWLRRKGSGAITTCL